MKFKEILEAQPAKISQVKPGQSAEIDHGDGTKTTVDLKKNPNILTKDPITKKIKLVKKQAPGSKPNPASIIKPGDQVDTDEN